MKSEEELLEIFKNKGLDSYKVNKGIDETKSIQLMNIEELFKFSNKHNIDTMFYCYSFIDEEFLSITDEITSALKLDEDALSVLQNKFDEYNESLSEVDFCNPVYLNIYCIYQGIIFFIQEEDYWFDEQGYERPESMCIQLSTEYLEDIVIKKTNRKQDRIENREKLRQQMLNDDEFKKCTNKIFRGLYADKIFKNNSANQQLFYSKREGIYDIPIHFFVEDIWREYKDSLKK